MAGLFYNLGKAIGPKLRKGKWVWNSLTAGEDEILQSEYETGRDMAGALLRETPPAGDERVAMLVTGAGERLAGRLTNHKRRWAFHLIASDSPNAFALPGGFIFITQSLVELCKADPDEIAFIIGHEIGHVIRGHAFDRLVGSTLMTAASKAAPLGRVLTPGVMGVGLRLMQSAYTQDQETEADAFGLRLAHSAGFDPRASVRMMQRLQSTSGDGPLPEIFGYFSTHPPFAARIAALERLLSFSR